MPKVEEVFGISARPILRYTARDQVDGRFVTAIGSDHHIIVYGASKQGKTALRQKHMPEDSCEIYRCNPNTNPEGIYQHILRKADVQIETSETKTDSTKTGGKIGWSIKAVIPWLADGSASGELAKEKGRQRSLTTEFVDVNLADAQTVATILKTAKFDRFIVLENFHYLPRDVQ